MTRWVFEDILQVEIPYENTKVFSHDRHGFDVRSEVYDWMDQYTDEWRTSGWFDVTRDPGGIGFVRLGKKFHFPTKQLTMHFKLVWS